jgi:predicted Rossmann fold nucleotide-binding protein DprA/Smf involved in DNA uptake
MMGIDDTLNSLHLVVIAAVFIGADTADEIAVRLGLDVDDVAVLLAELEEAGALTVVPRS